MVGIMYHTGLERFRMFIVAHQRENLLGNPLREALNLFTKYLGLARIQVVDPGFLRIVKEAHDRCLLWSDPFESGQDAAENCGPKRMLCHTSNGEANESSDTHCCFFKESFRVPQRKRSDLPSSLHLIPGQQVGH